MKINKTIVAVTTATVTAVILPGLALAGGAGNAGAGFTGFLQSISGWLSQIGLLLFAAATLAFFWGLVKFIYQPEDTEKGKNLMIWGIIAIFVMFSIWAIIKFLQDSTGTGGVNSLNAPDVPGIAGVPPANGG